MGLEGRGKGWWGVPEEAQPAGSASLGLEARDPGGVGLEKDQRCQSWNGSPAASSLLPGGKEMESGRKKKAWWWLELLATRRQQNPMRMPGSFGRSAPRPWQPPTQGAEC